MKFVFDTYAWVEYFKGTEAGAKVKEIIESQDNEIFSSIMTIAELCSKLKRENMEIELAYNSVLNLSKIYFISPEFAKETGILHAKTRKNIKDFGMIDAFILLTARKLGAKIVTGDPHFKKFKEAVLI